MPAGWFPACFIIWAAFNLPTSPFSGVSAPFPPTWMGPHRTAEEQQQRLAEGEKMLGLTRQGRTAVSKNTLQVGYSSSVTAFMFVMPNKLKQRVGEVLVQATNKHQCMGSLVVRAAPGVAALQCSKALKFARKCLWELPAPHRWWAGTPGKAAPCCRRCWHPGPPQLCHWHRGWLCLALLHGKRPACSRSYNSQQVLPGHLRRGVIPGFCCLFGCSFSFSECMKHLR